VLGDESIDAGLLARLWNQTPERPETEQSSSENTGG
jgi:hypothetical protein